MRPCLRPPRELAAGAELPGFSASTAVTPTLRSEKQKSAERGGRQYWFTDRVADVLAAAGHATGRMIAGRARGLAIAVQAIANRSGLGAATRKQFIHAVNARFVPAKRDLVAAIVVEADVAGVPAVFGVIVNVHTLTAWRPARAAGSGRSAYRILAARCEEKAGAGEESRANQKGSHRSPLKSVSGGSRA